jgi:hypothetical protein
MRRRRRSLERALAALCRSVALDVARGSADGTMTTAPVELTPADVRAATAPPPVSAPCGVA